MAKIARRMKEGGHRAIFYEEAIDPKVARVIARETGAIPLLLHGAHNVGKDDLAAGVTDMSIVEGNLGRLKQGLECP